MKAPIPLHPFERWMIRVGLVAAVVSVIVFLLGVTMICIALYEGPQS